MQEDVSKQEKAVRPHAFFDEPHKVMIDPDLSKEQKKHALEALEQDARQLEVATEEGMCGGEKGGLHEILTAKVALDLPPVEFAYDIVLKDLRSRLNGPASGHDRAQVEQALAALSAVTMSAASSPVSGMPT